MAAEAVLVETGEECGPGRRAHGAVAVEVGEAEAVLCEGIEVGGVVDLGAVAAEVGVTEVIGEDEDDVGGRLGVGVMDGRPQNTQNTQKAFMRTFCVFLCLLWFQSLP